MFGPSGASRATASSPTVATVTCIARDSGMCSCRYRSSSPGDTTSTLPSLVIRQRLRVDEDEGHPAHRAAAVRPRVVRAALDHHVARAHERLALVQDGPDLSLEADRVVDRVGGVEARVLRRAVRGGLGAAPSELIWTQPGRALL